MFKGLITSFIPYKWGLFLKKISEQFLNNCEFKDEETNYTEPIEKRPHTSNGVRWLHLKDGLDFSKAYLDTTMEKKKVKEFSKLQKAILLA